jgi:hypothetical protein
MIVFKEKLLLQEIQKTELVIVVDKRLAHLADHPR